MKNFNIDDYWRSQGQKPTSEMKAELAEIRRRTKIMLRICIVKSLKRCNFGAAWSMFIELWRLGA